MDVFKLAAFGILAAALVALIRAHKPEMALPVAVTAGVILLVFVVSELTGVVDGVRGMATSFGIDLTYIEVLIKIIGIAYVAQFGAEICRDAGDGAMASKVELGGRVMILAAALPAAVALLKLVAGLIPGLQQ